MKKWEMAHSMDVSFDKRPGKSCKHEIKICGQWPLWVRSKLQDVAASVFGTWLVFSRSSTLPSTSCGDWNWSRKRIGSSVPALHHPTDPELKFIQNSKLFPCVLIIKALWQSFGCGIFNCSRLFIYSSFIQPLFSHSHMSLSLSMSTKG